MITFRGIDCERAGQMKLEAMEGLGEDTNDLPSTTGTMRRGIRIRSLSKWLSIGQSA